MKNVFRCILTISIDDSGPTIAQYQMETNFCGITLSQIKGQTQAVGKKGAFFKV